MGFNDQMENDSGHSDDKNLRVEVRVEGNKNASVEFIPGNCNIPYHFKLKDFSSKGLGIMVRNDSKVLKHIRPGDILDMKYHSDTATANPIAHRTEIKHISEPDPGKHENHKLVGLLILEDN